MPAGPNLHVRLGNLVWVIGGTFDCDIEDDVFSWTQMQITPDLSIGRKSMIWSLKKQRWYWGPVLPGKNFGYNYKVKCAIAVNSSTAFIFTKDYFSYPENTEFGWLDYNFSYDIQTKNWKSNTKPPPTIQPYNSAFLSCALSQTKKYQRYVYILSNLHCDNMNYIFFHYRQVHILAHRETSYPKFEEHVGIYIYDVELDSWTVKYFQDCNLGK